MTTIQHTIESAVSGAVKALYGMDLPADQVTVNATRKEFAGHYTVVTFPFTRAARKKPEQIGEELGAYLLDQLEDVSEFNVVKGFLNLTVADGFWNKYLLANFADRDFGRAPRRDEKVLVEFASPNTNKPLHLGHIRNILLGWSAGRILDAAGYDVTKVQIINDRGIAICKSMLAWQRFGDGATPQSTGTKPDHFVGDYYVAFETRFRAEYKQWQESPAGQAVYAEKAKDDQDAADFFKGYKNIYFNEYSDLGRAAKAMLLRWEAGDGETTALWQKMNGWVYEGFAATYERLGVSFDKLYYESNTYLLGKDMIERGLEKEVFFTKEDGSTWVDLTDAKMDEKAVLRSDGTSLYITQDLGTARLRYDDFGVNKMVYVVADEQNYHFQVLFEVLKRLEEPYAAGLYHLNYGMVDLTTGKMKSREGTVVDADDLMDEVVAAAREAGADRETTDDLSPAEQREIIDMVGMGALKFFILKVGPRKRMTFNPEESVDMQGQTGPYVQNAYVRTQAVQRRADSDRLTDLAAAAAGYTDLHPDETDLINRLYDFPQLIREAAAAYDPSLIAMYCYELAKSFHKFWHDHSILNADTEAAVAFRLALCQAIGNTLRQGMTLLGIGMPDRM